MAEVDALTQLKDIHLPPAVSWWPLAPGWYMLGALVCLLIFGVVFFLYKRYLNALPKKQALILLERYVTQYEQDKNGQVFSAQVSEVLKRVALVYYPRQQVASMYGEEWIKFLQETSKGINFDAVKVLLLDAPFKYNESLDLQPLIQCATLWVKQRKVPCLN